MRIDLNLLLILDALCRYGAVAKAADALALSQPAVSHALNRLRAATQDPLFTRSGRGLVPTPRALALAGDVAEIVAAGRACLAPEGFDPHVDGMKVRLGLSDYAGLTILPRLVAELAVRARHVTVEAVAVGPDALRQLQEGTLDLSFWGTAPPLAPAQYRRLFHESFVCVLRDGHPALSSGHLTLESYLAASHAVVSLGDPGASPVETALAATGYRRRIAVASHSFAANLAVVAASDLITSVPSRLARDVSPGLVSAPLPFLVPEFDYGMIWHTRTAASAGLRWLRDLIAVLA